jgi:hypothetical protein
MNYAKILSISVVILVSLAILSVLLIGTVSFGAYGTLLVSGFQVAVIAFGLSAIALAILRLSYK